VSARDALAHPYFDTVSDVGDVVLKSHPQQGMLPPTATAAALHAASSAEMGRRPEQQDRHSLRLLESPEVPDVPLTFVGVFDGHGSAEIADHLQWNYHSILVGAPTFMSNMAEALRYAFEQAEKQVGEMGQDAGSTALAMVLRPFPEERRATVNIANIGDCRAVLANEIPPDRTPAFRLGSAVEVVTGQHEGQLGVIEEERVPGRLVIVRLLQNQAMKPFQVKHLRLRSQVDAVRLTEDHKPDSERERKRIQALGGQVEPASQGGVARVQGLATSRCLGSTSRRPFVSPEPDLLEYELKSDSQFVIVASDGVWDVLSDQEAVDMVFTHIKAHNPKRGPKEVLGSAAELIVQAALQKGSTDNLTCVIVYVQGFWT